MQKTSSSSQYLPRKFSSAKVWGVGSSMQVKFNDDQRDELKKAGLFPPQVENLERMLPVIKERLKRPISSSSVREKLLSLKKSLIQVGDRMRAMPKSRAGGEALARLHQAGVQKAQNPHEMATLEALLKAANEVLNCAIAGVPKNRGKIGRSSPKLSGSGELITLIFGALQRGYVEYVDGSADMHLVPKFNIRVGHNKTFKTIAHIMFQAAGKVEATGKEVSFGDAVKAYSRNMKINGVEEKRMFGAER